MECYICANIFDSHDVITAVITAPIKNLNQFALEIHEEIRKSNHSITAADAQHHDLEANGHELKSIAVTGITLLTLALLVTGSVVYFLWSAVDYFI